jgi:hypothetical protein
MKDSMAIDQYGQTFHGLGPHPRKALLERLSRKHAAKMYVEKKDGSSVHIGWIIGGLWLTVYSVTRMEHKDC